LAAIRLPFISSPESRNRVVAVGIATLTGTRINFAVEAAAKVPSLFVLEFL
jgi:hypothetical protein